MGCAQASSMSALFSGRTPVSWQEDPAKSGLCRLSFESYEQDQMSGKQPVLRQKMFICAQNETLENQKTY
jgi:hypothetical protein